MAAKIFRINYKSDFILTLNSDAGWMTPFCIKFWTGAPSQAYYVGWDGTTYTHCVYDPSEPTKLMVQFDDHHLPIGDLKFQIAYHFTVADFPDDTEDEVINPANITTEIDGQTYQVMLDFTGETAPEIEFSLPAYANEAQRIENEQQRIANEQTRIENEQTRIQHEETREANEAQRIRQEQARVDAEESRTRQYAQDHQTAVNDHTRANEDHQRADEDHTRAESDHNTAIDDHTTATNDHTRAGQDHQQATNDHTRAESDHSRAGEDHQTATADHTRAGEDHQESVTQSAYAKDQGDYAKDQGDYAKQKGDDAAAQMQQQAQAFNEAQAARQTAYEQAEGTESGSVAGDGSRWGAFKTNEADRDAKVDAKVADITNLQEAVAEGAVYDVSAKNPTAGPNNDGKWESLSALLSDANLNTLIPTSVRKGGMSIKFVQSSDQKYVQYRMMSPTWSTNIDNWQGVDKEPISRSKNFVDSNGIFNSINSILGSESNYIEGKKYGYNIDFKQNDENAFAEDEYIPVNEGDEVRWNYGATYKYIYLKTYDSVKNTVGQLSSQGSARIFTVESGVKYIRASFLMAYKDDAYISVNGSIVWRPIDKVDGKIYPILEENNKPIYSQTGYYTCATAGNTAAKVVSDAEDYIIADGGSIKVKFTNKNTVDDATLNINGKGAKALYYQGKGASSTNSWVADEVVEIYYDGISYYANAIKGLDATTKRVVDDFIDNYNYYPLKIDLKRDTIYGSIQPNGAVATTVLSVLTSDFILVVGGSQITISTPTIIIEGDENEYSFAYRFVGMEDKSNTNAHLIQDKGQGAETATVTVGASDKYVRISFYLCIKGTTTEKGTNWIKNYLPENTTAIFSSNEFLWNLYNVEKVDELTTFINGRKVSETQIETSPTKDSESVVSSGGIYSYIKKEQVNLQGTNPSMFDTYVPKQYVTKNNNNKKTVLNMNTVCYISIDPTKVKQNISITNFTYNPGLNQNNYTRIWFFDAEDTYLSDYWHKNYQNKRINVDVSQIPSTATQCYIDSPLAYKDELLICIDDLDYITNGDVDYIKGKIDAYTDIITFNKDAVDAIKASKKYTFNSSGITEIPPLTLLHFSDIHNSAYSLQRIVDFKSSIAPYINDAICTGDMVQTASDTYGGLDFWNAVDGAKSIMMTIGNHDLIYGGNSVLSLQEQYEMYISPFVSEWGNVQTVENKTWYYKDYTSQKIRLIVLGSSYTMSSADYNDMETWFENVLSNSRQNNLSVIVAQHYRPNDATYIDCNFTQKDSRKGGNLYISNGLLTIIDDFIDAGGEFICHLCGHTHQDQIITSENHPRQLFLVICSSSSNNQQNVFGDINRIANTKSIDAFNVVTFDVNKKVLKIIRVGAELDMYLRKRETVTIQYASTDSSPIASPTIISSNGQ